MQNKRSSVILLSINNTAVFATSSTATNPFQRKLTSGITTIRKTYTITSFTNRQPKLNVLTSSLISSSSSNNIYTQITSVITSLNNLVLTQFVLVSAGPVNLNPTFSPTSSPTYIPLPIQPKINNYKKESWSHNKIKRCDNCRKMNFCPVSMGCFSSEL